MGQEKHMNYALIFAGGIGQRMNTISLPKQFLKVHDVPIIVYTIKHFQKCEKVDGIVVVCVKDYIDLMEQLKEEYGLTKIISIIPGGENGQGSIRNGLLELKKLAKPEDIVLIHDGVRPLINEETILKNIECVEKDGNCVTTTRSTETIVVTHNDSVTGTIDRENSRFGRAPQSFKLKDILEAHELAKKDNLTFIDSATMMTHYGHKLHFIDGPVNNIKITTPIDYFIFKAILDEKESEQINFL